MKNPRKLTFSQLRQINYKRCEKVFHKIDDWSPTDWACALAGECGEACNLIKKLRRLDGTDRKQDTVKYRAELIDAIGKEIADMVIYADLLAFRLGLSLDKEVIEKFNEVSTKRHCNIKL